MNFGARLKKYQFHRRPIFGAVTRCHRMNPQQSNVSRVPDGTLQVKVGFTPLKIGTCSDTLKISDGPFYYLKTLTGTGIEAISDQPEPYLTQNDEKVTICHRPPGNSAKPRTLRVGAAAVPAHEAHGDTLGACPN